MSMRTVRGFTLIELLVSIGIMSIMTGFLLSSYPDSAIRMTLINSVQSVALLIREAQVRGSAVDSNNASLGGYGVRLVIPNTTTFSQAVLFGDIVNAGTLSPNGLPIGNSVYDATPIDETKSTVTMPRNYSFAKICVGQSPSTCYADVGTSLTISFIRPSPLPFIYLNDSTATNYARACIELHSPRAPDTGHIRSIEVYSSGMVRTILDACN